MSTCDVLGSLNKRLSGGRYLGTKATLKASRQVVTDRLSGVISFY